MAKGYCCLPLKANKYSLSENKENRGFSDSIMWGPVHLGGDTVNKETIFKATESLEFFSSLPFIFLCIITIAITIIVVIKWKKSSFSFRAFFSFVALFLLICTLSVSITYIKDYANVFLPYKKGNYYEVEGYVSNYKTELINQIYQDSFEIDHVKFKLPTASSFGYTLTKSEGGIIHDGLHLIIKYRFFRFENVILEIEEVID